MMHNDQEGGRVFAPLQMPHHKKNLSSQLETPPLEEGGFTDRAQSIVIIDRDGSGIRENFDTEKKATPKPGNPFAGDCGDSPQTPTPLAISARSGLRQSPDASKSQKSSRPVTGQQTHTTNSVISRFSKQDKENSPQISPESSMSPVSKAALALRMDLGPTENPFVVRSTKAKDAPTFDLGKKKSKSSAAVFKATDVYLQRVQKKEPGFGIRLHRIGDGDLGGDSVEDSPDNMLKKLKRSVAANKEEADLRLRDSIAMSLADYNEELARFREEEQRLREEEAERERVKALAAEAERLEKERLAAEEAERERIAREKAEEEERRRKEAEAEAARLAAKLEAERIAAEAEAQRLAEIERKEREEAERLEQEAAKLEAERLEAERREQERLEQERLDAEEAEFRRIEELERQEAEKQRLDAEALERERFLTARNKERLDQQRREAERAELERLEQLRQEEQARREAVHEQERLIEQLKLEQKRLEERKRFEAAKLEEELREAYRQEQLRYAAQRRREAASCAYQEELASQITASPDLKSKVPLPPSIHGSDECKSHSMLNDDSGIVESPEEKSPVNNYLKVEEFQATAHHSSLGSNLPTAVMEAEMLKTRSCHIDEETYISRQIDNMKADLDNLEQAEQETKQRIEQIRSDVRDSNADLQITEHEIAESPAEYPSEFTVGQGLLAGSSTPIMLTSANGMSPDSSSPAQSSPMAPRICRDSPPTKQPSDQAPVAGDFNIKSLISPVEVDDDSPPRFAPRVVIERCDTMKEETQRDSQPSSHSQPESAGTFGFDMRQISCKSSDRGISPPIRSPARDSISNRSPGFILEPVAVPEANSAESGDEAVSERSCKTGRRDRRSRRNRTTSATNNVTSRFQGPVQPQQANAALEDPKESDSKKLVNIEVCFAPEEDAQPILTERSGGLDIFDQKFTIGQSGVHSSASPRAQGAMNIKDELGASSASKSPQQTGIEAEAECLSAGLLNIKLVRTDDAERTPMQQQHARATGVLKSPDRGSLEGSLFDAHLLRQQVEPLSASNSFSQSPQKTVGRHFSAVRPSHNQSRSCRPSPGKQPSPTPKRTPEVTKAQRICSSTKKRVSPYKARAFFSPAQEKPDVYGTFEALMDNQRMRDRRRAIEAAEEMLHSINFNADTESTNHYLGQWQTQGRKSALMRSESEHNGSLHAPECEPDAVSVSKQSQSTNRHRRSRQSRKSISVCSEAGPRAVPPMPSTQDKKEKRYDTFQASFADGQDFECESPVKHKDRVRAFEDMGDDVNTGSVTIPVHQQSARDLKRRLFLPNLDSVHQQMASPCAQTQEGSAIKITLDEVDAMKRVTASVKQSLKTKYQQRSVRQLATGHARHPSDASSTVSGARDRHSTTKGGPIVPYRKSKRAGGFMERKCGDIVAGDEYGTHDSSSLVPGNIHVGLTTPAQRLAATTKSVASNLLSKHRMFQKEVPRVETDARYFKQPEDLRSKSGSGIGRGLHQISQPSLPTARQIMQKSAPRPNQRTLPQRATRRPFGGANSEAKMVAAPAIYTQSAARLEKHQEDRESEVDFAPITSRIEHRAAPKKIFDSAKTKVGGRNSSYLKATSSFMQKMERHDSQQSLNSNYLAKISSRHNGSTMKKHQVHRSSIGQASSAQKARGKTSVHASTTSSAAKKRFNVMPRSFVQKIAQQRAQAEKRHEQHARKELSSMVHFTRL